MDQFTLFTIAALGGLFLIFWAIGKWYPGSGAEQVDWRPTRSPEVEAELELQDVDQMIEAQNLRRRASGRPEITEEEIRTEVEDAERWRKEQAARYRSESGDSDQD